MNLNTNPTNGRDDRGISAEPAADNGLGFDVYDAVRVHGEKLSAGLKI